MMNRENRKYLSSILCALSEYVQCGRCDHVSVELDVFCTLWSRVLNTDKTEQFLK